MEKPKGELAELLREMTETEAGFTELVTTLGMYAHYLRLNHQVGPEEFLAGIRKSYDSILSVAVKAHGS